MIRYLPLVELLLAIIASASAVPLVWENRKSIPGPGRHHPIVFANETHAFYLTGTTAENLLTNDFYMYEEAKDEWTDLSSSTSSFPGASRSFGYGVVLNEALNTKAYLGFGAGLNGESLGDWWEFNMESHVWTRLADFPGFGRRHPAMVPVRRNDGSWEIHVGLGDGTPGNLNDWWSYAIDTNTWSQLPDFPSSKRHHPFYFGLGSTSYAGLGHSNGGIERDWYRYEDGGGWTREPDFASYNVTDEATNGTGPPVTTEARVAGTEFSIELPLLEDDTSGLSGSLGFVLSGDGDDHRTIETGEFHAFYLGDNETSSWWRQLPPHPGTSRWAPGSFVMRGTARAYFTSGYDRASQLLYNDLWTIDLSPLFSSTENTGETPPPTNDPTTARATEPPNLTENAVGLPPTNSPTAHSAAEVTANTSGASSFSPVCYWCIVGGALSLLQLFGH